MIIRQNRNGGPKLKGCPTYIEGDRIVHKLGYLPNGEPVGMAGGDFYEFLSYAGIVDKEEEKKPMRQKLGEWLLKDRI